MERITPASPRRLLADSCLAFTPAPSRRQRADGWTPETQAHFIRALEAMGLVGKAAKAVGMGRASAYRLRNRSGAASFAAAWDRAISMGRTHQYSIAMDRALNGVATVRVLKGGAIDVSGGPTWRLSMPPCAAKQSGPVPPRRQRRRNDGARPSLLSL